MSYRLRKEQIMEQTLKEQSYCDIRLCGKKKKPRCVNILIIEIYQWNCISLYHRHHIVNSIVQSALIRFPVFHTSDFQHVSTPVINDCSDNLP